MNSNGKRLSVTSNSDVWAPEEGFILE